MSQNKVSTTLEERGERYGEFKGHSEVTQSLKRVIYCNTNTAMWSDSQREAMDMIVHKIGRIVNGDPDYIDSWHDIAGYASLVVKELEQEQNTVEF